MRVVYFGGPRDGETEFFKGEAPRTLMCIQTSRVAVADIAEDNIDPEMLMVYPDFYELKAWIVDEHYFIWRYHWRGKK